MEDLDPQELREAKEALLREYKAMKNSKEELKRSEDSIVEEMCMSLQFYKRDKTTPDKAKIKKALLKSAIDIEYEDARDLLSEKLDTQEEYRKFVKDESVVSKANIQSFLSKKGLVEEMKETIKDLESSISEKFSQPVTKALKEIVVQEMNSEENLSDGENNEEFMKLIKKIKEAIKS